MMQTIEAIIRKDGSVQLLEKVQLPSSRRAIVTILQEQPQGKNQRPYGLCVGEFVVPKTFDEPLPEDILVSFEG
jgi:hypothetical protein